MAQQEADETSSVVTGALLIFYLNAYVLVDFGAIHSLFLVSL